jgi:hypothetical protein
MGRGETSAFAESLRRDRGVSARAVIGIGGCRTTARQAIRFGREAPTLNLPLMHKPSGDVAEYQGVIILPGLIRHDPRIGAVRGIELVLPAVRNSGREPKEKSLRGHNVDCIDPIDPIHIRRRQPATR